MILHSVYFSPSGTTKRVAELVTGNIAGRSVNYDITQLVDISPAIGADDVVMFVMPVYACLLYTSDAADDNVRV